LESHFSAGPAAFWPSKQADEIGNAMFLVPVSRVWCAKLGHKFLLTRNLGGELGSSAIHLIKQLLFGTTPVCHVVRAPDGETF